MSYRNPVTYVDSQSGKYFASAIQNISNTTAGVIDTLGAKAEAERKKKALEFELVKDDVDNIKKDMADIKGLLQRLVENNG